MVKISIIIAYPLTIYRPLLSASLPHSQCLPRIHSHRADLPRLEQW